MGPTQGTTGDKGQQAGDDVRKLFEAALAIADTASMEELKREAERMELLLPEAGDLETVRTHVKARMQADWDASPYAKGGSGETQTLPSGTPTPPGETKHPGTDTTKGPTNNKPEASGTVYEFEFDVETPDRKSTVRTVRVTGIESEGDALSEAGRIVESEITEENPFTFRYTQRFRKNIANR